MTNPVLQAGGLFKRYGRRLALSDCTLAIPPGHVVGLVGPNGAGKTTLLQIAAGMLPPTSGSITVRGGRPGSGVAQLAKVGFVAQDTPAYAGLSIADHLRFGAHLNPQWDQRLAEDRITGPAHPGRTGGQLRSVGPPRVPAEPAVLYRRSGRQRHPLLPPGLRPRTRLRLPDRAGCFPGPHRRRGRRAAGDPSSAQRGAARPGRPAGWRSGQWAC